jgi:hypothetical protein
VESDWEGEVRLVCTNCWVVSAPSGALLHDRHDCPNEAVRPVRVTPHASAIESDKNWVGKLGRVVFIATTFWLVAFYCVIILAVFRDERFARQLWEAWVEAGRSIG